MRGRVMALWAVVFLGSTPIGGPLTGLIVHGFGVRAAIAVGGVAALATAAGAYWALRRRQLRAGACEAPVCLPDGPAPGDALGEGSRRARRRRPGCGDARCSAVVVLRITVRCRCRRRTAVHGGSHAERGVRCFSRAT